MRQYNGYEPIDWREVMCEKTVKGSASGAISVILFVLSICSVWLSFFTALLVGEVDIFTIRGMIRYSWVVYFFVIIPLISLGFGVFQKKKGKKYRKNFVIAFVCIPILILLGSFKFAFEPDDYRSENVTAVEYECGVDLPNNVKALTYYKNDYTMIYAKALDKGEKLSFEESIKINSVWTESLSGSLKATIPDFVVYDFIDCDYFVYFNATKGIYNSYYGEGEYSFSVIGYDIELGRIVILNNCVFNAD